MTSARLGVLAASFAVGSVLAGEPIIMGNQRTNPDPGHRPRMDERIDQTQTRARISNPLNDGSSLQMTLLPPPVAAPSRRSQNARDEKENWMMLNPGDLTEGPRSEDAFGIGSMSNNKNAGRRNYFFEKPETPNASAQGYQALSSSTPDLFGRSGKLPGSISNQDEESRKRREENTRDSLSSASGAADGGKSIEDPGMGPLMNPGKVSGGAGIERWSASIDQVIKRRPVEGVNDAQTLREHYLEYLGSAHYSGPSYPANTEWGKYQREWAGSAADARAAGSALPGSALGNERLSRPSSLPTAASSSSLGSRTLDSTGGNLSGMGTMPSYLQQRSAPSPKPKIDYSLPKSPGNSFDFR